MARSADGGSVVDEVTERIALQIASGDLAPGERLPSVRGLASLHGINPSTVQVVLERLRTAGFVEASRGLGTTVIDIEQEGGIETWRTLFRFAVQLPDRATSLLEDFLRTRRVLMLEVVRVVASDPDAYELQPLRRAVDRLQRLAEGDASVEAFARAELRTARMLLLRVERPVLLAMYNSIAAILLSVPEALQAIYLEPRFNVALWQGLLSRWERRDADPLDTDGIEAALAAFHVECVGRFRRLLDASAAGGPRSTT